MALLVAIGSSGDVHPMMALGLGLAARGHRVAVVANDHFGPVIRAAGLDHVSLGTAEEFATMIDPPGVWDPIRSLPLVIEWGLLRPMRPTFEVIEGLRVPGETVVVAPPIALGARVAREALGVPLVTVALHPSYFRSAACPPLLPPLPVSPRLPRAWNRACYRLADLAVDRLLGPAVNAFLAELGLPRARRFLDRWWFSPGRVLALFPDWFAPLGPGWPEQTRLVGFPTFDGSAGAPPPPEFEAFLGSGPPPLVFTPGSANRHASRFFRAAADACRRLGRRAAFVTRFADQVPAPLPEGVRHFASVPFGRAFPRAAAAIHHGGIGTASLALEAGIPQLLMPMAYDQPDNAARLVALGVARSLPPRRFRGLAVAEALGHLLDDPEVARRCRDLAFRTREGDPLSRCLDLIEAEVIGGALP